MQLATVKGCNWDADLQRKLVASAGKSIAGGAMRAVTVCQLLSMQMQ